MLKKLLLNDRFILWVILLNAAIIFGMGFAPAAPWDTRLEAIDHFITIIFILELIVKVRQFGFREYLTSNWNVMDMVLVVLAIPSLILWLLPTPNTGLSFLLIFRILRVFKFFRFIKFVPKAAHLVEGIRRAMKASVLILIAFFVFNFIVSLISCFLFREIAPEYFSNPLVSLYSTFKVFTVEGWYEIPDALAESLSPGMTVAVRIYFIIILFFGGIFGLSLVNSIFVDSMVSDNTDTLEHKIDALQARLDEVMQKLEENSTSK